MQGCKPMTKVMGRKTQVKAKTPMLMPLWTDEDLDVVCQICYKTDLDRFQTYRCNKIMPADLSTINTKDHSTYIEIAKAHPGTVFKKSVFSVAT